MAGWRSDWECARSLDHTLIDALAAELDPDVHGDVRVHFYPFGGLAKTAEWVACRR